MGHATSMRGFREASRRAPWLLALLLACGGPGGWVRESGDVGSQGGADGIVSALPDAPEEGDAAPAGSVGSACTSNDECVTSFCMTTENIGAFIKGAVVPDGYCSALFCAVDGSDGACAAAMGGTCFSLYPFLGADFGGSGICLAPCDDDAACRTGDDNVCFDAQTLVDQGLLDASVIAQYYANGTRGCLPATVAQAAVDKLKQRRGGR
jgi:hypothetical protein